MPLISTFYDHILDISTQLSVSVAEALQEARSLGISQLEVSFHNGDGHTQALSRELSAAGMGISAIPAYFSFGRGADVSAQAQPVFQLAKELGADRLLVIPGFVQGRAKEAAAQAEAMLEDVALLGELADKASIRLTMEDYDNASAPYSTSAGMLRFLHACPQLSACFDTGNFRFMAEDTLSAYGALRGRIGHVHLKDRASAPDYGDDGLTATDGAVLYPCPVGAGGMPIAQVLDMLRADGYQGTYTIEHYGARDMLSCLKASVAWLAPRLGLGEQRLAGAERPGVSST